MDFFLYLTMIGLGFVGSFFSGLLGIGGAIINYPLLLFIPAGLGLAHFNAQEVSSISMFQVFFASLAGVITYYVGNKLGSRTQEAKVHTGLVLYMGISILIGSLAGAAISKYLSSESINLIYGILAVAAVVLMLIPARGVPELSETGTIQFNKIIAASSALIVGIVSGIVGAGGAFILIPIMLTVLHIPTKTTIATSLAIVLISAIGGVAGKITAGHILLWPTLFTVVGSLMGAPLGTRVSARINGAYLRYVLVVLISATAIKIWSSIIL
ncbi:sulfite exporter TauE/SafE family protein [Paenibacillus tuaregi]|uniref:sulfite exporter TauE/SafE family protein n=1 Tax=Paenibacillus tuaregi TaxID=1816681 RepID=UPI000837E7F6|nr:sulfite exporter TauE/SafE family protein [Paenibacillus tuaregi]